MENNRNELSYYSFCFTNKKSNKVKPKYFVSSFLFHSRIISFFWTTCWQDENSLQKKTDRHSVVNAFLGLPNRLIFFLSFFISFYLSFFLSVFLSFFFFFLSFFFIGIVLQISIETWILLFFNFLYSKKT